METYGHLPAVLTATVHLESPQRMLRTADRWPVLCAEGECETFPKPRLADVLSSSYRWSCSLASFSSAPAASASPSINSSSHGSLRRPCNAGIAVAAGRRFHPHTARQWAAWPFDSRSSK